MNWILAGYIVGVCCLAAVFASNKFIAHWRADDGPLFDKWAALFLILFGYPIVFPCVVLGVVWSVVKERYIFPKEDGHGG